MDISKKSDGIQMVALVFLSGLFFWTEADALTFNTVTYRFSSGVRGDLSSTLRCAITNSALDSAGFTLHQDGTNCQTLPPSLIGQSPSDNSIMHAIKYDQWVKTLPPSVITNVPLELSVPGIFGDQSSIRIRLDSTEYNQDFDLKLIGENDTDVVLDINVRKNSTGPHVLIRNTVNGSEVNFRPTESPLPRNNKACEIKFYVVNDVIGVFVDRKPVYNCPTAGGLPPSDTRTVRMFTGSETETMLLRRFFFGQ